MVWDKWWPYADNVAQYEKDEWGVYELADDPKNTVYYGSGKVKTRLLDHLNKKECPLARYYRVDMLINEAQCRTREEELLSQYRIAHGKLPIYNERMGQIDARDAESVEKILTKLRLCVHTVALVCRTIAEQGESQNGDEFTTSRNSGSCFGRVPSWIAILPKWKPGSWFSSSSHRGGRISSIHVFLNI